MHKRPIFQQLFKRLQEPRRFIQALLGPRQVGKTTLVLQVVKEINQPFHYISADLAALQNLTWLQQQWEVARQKIKESNQGILVIDEVQKIPHWSDMIKLLWDQDTQNEIGLSVVILGSSPWLMQKGLSDSLAGRFEVIPVTHWPYLEMKNTFGWSLDEYLYFGGYPGSAGLADKADVTRWMNYISDSLIETTLSRDILLMCEVHKPVLLRRLFQLGCCYSGQILSYSKMLGELQDAGNTTTLAHYLDLLMGAGLVMGLQKFAGQKVRQKGSSPKLLVYNTALMTSQMSKSYHEAKKDSAFWGRLVESAVGAHLLNSIRGTQIELFYWREGSREVDFVLKLQDMLIAIEVKSGKGFLDSSGMDLFVKQYNPSSIILVGGSGLSVQEFLEKRVQDLFL